VNTHYEALKTTLKENSQTWLITGVAGFIGSNLLEVLLKHEQRVVGLDNFATGHQRSLDEVRSLVTAAQWERFNFIEGNIRNLNHYHKTSAGIDYVQHQAALGSMPRSIQDLGHDEPNQYRRLPVHAGGGPGCERQTHSVCP